jgi:hypothetical protein
VNMSVGNDRDDSHFSHLFSRILTIFPRSPSIPDPLPVRRHVYRHLTIVLGSWGTAYKVYNSLTEVGDDLVFCSLKIHGYAPPGQSGRLSDYPRYLTNQKELGAKKTLIFETTNSLRSYLLGLYNVHSFL